MGLYINRTGELVIKPQYSSVTDFSDSLASVHIPDEDFRNNQLTRTYIIDKTGSVKFGPFENTNFMKFVNGLAFGTKYISYTCREYFYINTKGAIIRRDTVCKPKAYE
jgi:hypothetical protein